MGGSGWHYVTPYRHDVDTALQELKGRVFAARNFFCRRRWFRRPTTIEEALAWTAEEGTHSILDMIKVRRESAPNFPEIGGLSPEELSEYLLMIEPWHGSVSPLSDAWKETLFGSAQPKQEQVRIEELSFRILEIVPSWYGVYFPIYDNSGEPVLYGFVGTSGS